MLQINGFPNCKKTHDMSFHSFYIIDHLLTIILEWRQQVLCVVECILSRQGNLHVSDQKWAQDRSPNMHSINSLRPSDAYMRQKPDPSVVQIMACRLFGAKPLSEPMTEYC